MPTENRWLRKPWTGLSWVKVFTQGPFQWQRSHVSIFPARRGDFSICKMGCDLEPGSWFQNISLSPLQTLSWGHLIVERNSQPNREGWQTQKKRKEGRKRKHIQAPICFYTYSCVYLFVLSCWLLKNPGNFIQKYSSSGSPTHLRDMFALSHGNTDLESLKNTSSYSSSILSTIGMLYFPT